MEFNLLFDAARFRLTYLLQENSLSIIFQQQPAALLTFCYFLLMCFRNFGGRLYYVGFFVIHAESFSCAQSSSMKLSGLGPLRAFSVNLQCLTAWSEGENLH